MTAYSSGLTTAPLGGAAQCSGTRMGGKIGTGIQLTVFYPCPRRHPFPPIFGA